MENGRFLTLTTFFKQAQEADTKAKVRQLITAFAQAQGGGTQVELVATAVPESETNLCLPISQTGHWLAWHHPTPLADEEHLFAQLLTSCLAQSPYFQNQLADLQAHAHRLQILQSITETARTLRPLDDTLERIHSQLRHTFDAPNSYIALYDPITRLITFPCVVEDDMPGTQDPVSSLDENSLATWVVLNNRAYITHDWLNDEKPVVGVLSGSDTRSLMIVPIQADEDVLGVISLQSPKVGAFSQSDFQLLESIAEEVAVLIRNAQRYTAARQLVDDGIRDYQTAVALRQAIATIGTSLDPNVILNNLLLAISDLLIYDTAYVFVWQDEQLQYITGYDYYERPLPVTPENAEKTWHNHPLILEIMHSREPLYLPDTHQEPRWPNFTGHEEIRSWLGLPLVIGGQLLGVLMANSQRHNAFNKHEQWLASTLGTHTAVALQNAHLHQKTEQQLRELGTLYQASATMTANLDQNFVLQTVASEMVRAVQVDSCSIFVWDEAHQNLQLSAHESNLYPQRLNRDRVAAPTGLRNIRHLEQYPIVQRVLETQEIHSLRHDNAYSPHHTVLLKTAELQSLLLVPLVRRNKVFGLLALGQINEPRTFTPSELRLTQNLAGQAAVAIEHAHLFAQTQRRVAELATFHQIVLQLNTPLKLTDVLDSITEATLKLVEASNMHIFLYDAVSQIFTFGSALWRNGGRKAAVATPRNNGITMAVVRQGNPIVINDAHSHPLFQSPKAKGWGICAIAGFPLKQENQVIGVFTTTYLFPHTFSEDELLLLNLLADQAAVAVKNARLYDEAQRRLRDMSALVDMAKQVTSSLNLTAVLPTTVQILRRLLNARASTITMLSRDGAELVVEAAAGISPEYVKARMKLGEGVSGDVVRRGEPVYIRDTYSEPNFLFFDEVVRSLLVVPLIIRDKTRGTLTIDSDKPNAFNSTDMQIMTIAAAQVSIAIANARLFEELEDRAKELAVAYEELKENDRLKDELVQNVSHELRTPLTFVKGYVDLLLAGEMGLLNEMQQDALQIVATKTDDITRLIDDIMTLQRIDAGNLQLDMVPLGELIQVTVAGHSMVAEKRHLDVRYEIEKESVAPVDRGRINQVLDNLIGNAIKFSPNGGTITVTLQDKPDMALISVMDQGIGVPPDKLDRIFDRFYQVDGSSRRRFGGTGLGLAIVKRIVEAHHGQIWVESEVNKGSTFTFTLPKQSSRMILVERV